MADDIFEVPRLAQLYDPLDPDRGDLDVYVALVDELGARSVLDVGCGTGTFALMLAQRGLDVVGLDPARASLDVARAKPGADAVRWLEGDATALPPLQVDLATMTGNVAQVFVTDEDWARTVTAVREALRPGGHLVLETRVPEREAWRGWTREATHRVADVAGVGRVEAWGEVTDVVGELVTFRWTWVFESDGAVLTSDSTLRFRDRAAVEGSLTEAGFEVVDVREAPDRPGMEMVFVASRGAGRGRSRAPLPIS
ncbi:class I SAM-dependent methyltransferase [Cellulomonas fengjieae]|uniref:Class I SAM-dependent methyltransferase n=2 Tax=Cellulomonas fengjieae TaxID=2819978 RepID=A0ABS3SL48_9CELL|nr:class I SAM-dependent methyltransferase [Cellulomonas fengjieae]MBO3086469.1 class I SAM-dependent methyltransferase [Cellulomonas fengjieae]